MLRIRRLEEKAAELYSATKIRGFLHLYNGEEAVAVGVMQALTPEDNIIATYREHGQALARGMSAGSIMAELYGKQEGCSRGRGGSMHLFDKETRFYGGNAIVGGHLPLAVGMALADKLRGVDRVTCCFFGDGAVAEGEFHEAMNLCALWELPVLWVCENNHYGMGTALEYSESETNIAKKAASYKIESADGGRHGCAGRDGAGHEVMRTPCAAAKGRVSSRPNLSLPGPLHVRRRTLSREERGRRVETSRSDSDLLRLPLGEQDWPTTTIWTSSRQRSRPEIDEAVEFAEDGHVGTGGRTDPLRLLRRCGGRHLSV